MKQFDWSTAVQQFVMLISLDFWVIILHKMNSNNQSSEYLVTVRHTIKRKLTFEWT